MIADIECEALSWPQLLRPNQYLTLRSWFHRNANSDAPAATKIQLVGVKDLRIESGVEYHTPPLVKFVFKAPLPFFLRPVRHVVRECRGKNNAGIVLHNRNVEDNI